MGQDGETTDQLLECLLTIPFEIADIAVREADDPPFVDDEMVLATAMVGKFGSRYLLPVRAHSVNLDCQPEMWVKVGKIDVAQRIVVIVEFVFRVQMGEVVKCGPPDSVEKEFLGVSEACAQSRCTRRGGMQDVFSMKSV